MALAGLILAGGAGKRWGGPKAWARLPDGRSFLEACAMTLREAGASPVVATLPHGSDDPHIAGLEVVVLPREGLDMFASLLTGLESLLDNESRHPFVVLPVDHPLVSPSTVVALAKADSAAAVPTFHRKHGHPVLLSRNAAEDIVNQRYGGSTLRDVLGSLHPAAVPVDDPAVIANCNTPEALASALRAVQSRTETFTGRPARPKTQNSKLKTQN